LTSVTLISKYISTLQESYWMAIFEYPCRCVWIPPLSMYTDKHNTCCVCLYRL
jgi:hypothetical protein